MKKVLCLIFLLFACSAVAELSIPQTSFRKAPLDTLEKFVSDGDAEAMVELALRYYAGHEVERDVRKAFELMEVAADQQQPEALYLMSRMYAEGIGTEADSEQEELWFAKAIASFPDNKQLNAMFERYLVDPVRAERVLKKCADAGYGPAVLQLGFPKGLEFYENGQYEDALLLFITLAENGSADGAYYAGRIYADGLGNLEADDVEAFMFFKQAAESGYAPAQYELAVSYENGCGIEKDSGQAMLWYQTAADSGYSEAQFRLAEMAFRQAEAAESAARFDDRSGLELNKYRKALSRAVQWYQAAAEQDHAGALFVMGRLTASGEGVGRNPQKAVEYYEQALALGYAEAGFYLGLMFHAGLGVQKDLSQAIQYYQAAADQGVSGALYYLANCYRFGEGVSKHSIKGEGIYYGKLLKGFFQDNSELLPDEWMLRAAREYGIIRWNRGGGADRLSNASRWVGMSAQNGDARAQEVFAKMQDAEGQQLLFEESRVDPRKDAGEKRRQSGWFPYVLLDAEDLYSGNQVDIISVQEGLGSQENVAGNAVDGLLVRYERPATSHLLGYSGIILAGLEFTDRETGERYWSFSEYRDQEPLYAEASRCDFFVSVDQDFCERSKLTGWAVVYGQLLEDGRTIAVFDSRQSKTDGLSVFFKRSQYFPIVDNRVNANIDLLSLVMGQMQSTAEDEASRVRDFLLSFLGL